VGRRPVTVIFIAAAAILVVKTTLLEGLRVAGILPDLFLALVGYAALYRGRTGGLLTGALVGSLIALASPVERAPVYPLVYGIAGWLAGVAWGPIMRRSFASEFLILLALGFAVDAFLLAREIGLSHGLLLSIPLLVIPSALATALTGPLLFAAIRRVLKRLRQRAPFRVHARR
jgi:hypothetical protein